MKGEDRRIGVFTITMAASYLLVISLSKTKLAWYAAPVYPFLSLLFVVTLRSLIARRPRGAWIRPATIALTCGAAVLSAVMMTKQIDQRASPTGEERLPVQLAAFRQAFPGTNHVVLGTPTYQGPSVYYQQYFARRGLVIRLADLDGLKLHRGDTILTSVAQIKGRLREDYDTEPIFSFESMEGEVIRQVRLPHPREIAQTNALAASQ
jgi:hypothetical protein